MPNSLDIFVSKFFLPLIFNDHQESTSNRIPIFFFPQPIPINFVRRYLKKKAQTMTILQVGERCWSVKLLTYKSFSKFSGGWAAFARENFLRPRDVCIFELVKRNQLQLKVSIFKQSGLAQE